MSSQEIDIATARRARCWVLLLALAPCARPCVVPVAPGGLAAGDNGDNPSAIYPDLLRAASAQSHCEFKLIAAPRARQEAMFRFGTADMLVAAVPGPRHDQVGEFVPLLLTRATLLSIDGARAPAQQQGIAGPARIAGGAGAGR